MMSFYGRKTSETSSTSRRLRALALAAMLMGLLMAVPAAFAQDNMQFDETYNISMKNYSYTPNEMTWHVGDLVKITLTNESTDKEHEMLVGKDVNYSTDDFGNKYPDGWQTTLFESMDQVTFGEGTGIAELRADGPGTVALDTKGGTVSFWFKVPDKKGDWQFGCFEEDGSHFGDHNMYGTIHIVD